MPQRTSLAIGSLLALTLGSAGTLLAPAASATSPYANTHWHAAEYIYANGCSAVPNPATPPADAPAAADGARHTFNQDYTATVTNTGDGTDITDVTYSQNASGSLGARGSDPSSISMAYSGKTTVTPHKTPSLCQVEGYVEAQLHFDFTLTKPMWVNVSLSSRGHGYTEVYIYDVDNDPYLDMYNDQLKVDTSGRAYLPAGHYSGYLEGDTDIAPTTTAASGSMRATFTVPGSKSTGPSGKAKSYVGLGSARSCATHTLATKVTTNKKRAKTIKKIVFTVNGHKVKTVRSHLRGKTIPLTLSDTKAANVKATVTTVTVKKKHHHKKKIHKTRTVTASYLACS